MKAPGTTTETTMNAVSAQPLGRDRRWRRWAQREVSLASLAAFRVLFGAVLLVGTLRFLGRGWIEKQYVEPTFFFKYWGFSFIEVWSPTGLYLHFSAMALCAALICLGLFYRVATVGFTLLFAYAELMDVTNYLNHYMLVIWLCLLLCVSPAHGMWSLDAWRAPRLRRHTVPLFLLVTFRAQVAVVYLYAAWAKVGADWLLHGQPLDIWLSSRSDMWLVGPLFTLPATPLVMSWAGFLYDATIVLWLSIPRTRPVAYLVVLGFHGFTGALFDIGMFPGIMSVATLLFFSPSWPLRFVPHRAPPTTNPRRPAWLAPLLMGFLLVQVLLPARHVLYGGDVLWHEQGMRYAWKVMVREKAGSVTYRVVARDGHRTWHVAPTDYLTWRQANEMSGQPDLILQLGQHIAWDFARRGRGDVAVYVDALVSLNGRAAARLIDPGVDLTTVTDGIARHAWILPAPASPPLGG